MSVNCILFKQMVNYVIFFNLVTIVSDNIWQTPFISNLYATKALQTNYHYLRTFAIAYQSLYSLPIQSVNF